VICTEDLCFGFFTGQQPLHVEVLDDALQRISPNLYRIRSTRRRGKLTISSLPTAILRQQWRAGLCGLRTDTVCFPAMVDTCGKCRQKLLRHFVAT
jgi:hypothetical protein